MDPVGPWSAAYAQYNRLQSGQATQGAGEIHHHLTPSAATNIPPSTTAQILSAGFLTPSAYEGVFPLFHHASAKPPTHYINQQRQVLAQAAQAAQAVQAAQAQAAQAVAKQSEEEYHNAQSFFEQNASAWQQNSPFGILPHESVVSSSNFNAHLAAQGIHLNTLAKNVSPRPQAPQATIAKSNTTFYQTATTFSSNSDTPSNNKTYTSSPNTQALPQTCIVSSSNESKDYRVPQGAASARTFVSPAANSPRVEKFVPPITKQAPQIQTKAQTKIYPELTNQIERRNTDDQAQASVISFTVNESQRLNYNNVANSKRNFQGNYRQYQQGINTEAEFQRSTPSSSNGSDCATVVVPRRPSPLQAHSQASPIGHAPSPVYPVYNSPMNSQISSPQNAAQSTSTTSPLDVSLPRSNAQTNIGYSSVITRALTTPNQSQTCWDERRKFGNYNNPGNSIEIPSRQIDVPNRTELPQRQPPASTLNIPERQQIYFDSNHQVTLQDLSSCRGDPMSLVKNLQQQQSCQVPQVDNKQNNKVNKRRKSNEKTVNHNNESTGRVPPPAHSSATNSNQQNGAYFDFDRWNLPPGTSKIFTPQSLPQHHQGLMVPHLHTHHPQPPLPYFPPFHIAGHPTEYQSVELTPISNYNEQNQAQSQYQPEPDDQPKVVVPNIEEELNFLNDPNITVRRTPQQVQQSKAINPPNVAKPADAKPAPNAGFLCSYLKFLQGERETSPPSASSRGGRKSWINRSKAPSETPRCNVNGVTPAVTPVIPPPAPAPIMPVRLSQGDPQDDPRYFPLPKERKGSIASSDDGISSDDEFFKKVSPITTKDGKIPKKRGPKPGHHYERRRRPYKRREKTRDDVLQMQIAIKDIPRRESTKRAAKDRISKLMLKEDEEAQEFVDSDTDPAWTPLKPGEPEPVEGQPPKKGKRGRPSLKKRNLITAAAENAGINDCDSYINNKALNTCAPTLEDNIAAAVAQDSSMNDLSQVDKCDFKSGEFVGLKSEMHLPWPQELWRVDGINLRKFEPFDDNGARYYKIVPIYSSLTVENRNLYTPILVKSRSQNDGDLIVELIGNDLNMYNEETIDKSVKSHEVYQDNFEVYIQTLISQALDNNFLKEIFHEKDDYFLTNVKMIDDITALKRSKLINSFGWVESLLQALSIWPCFNIITDFMDTFDKTCIACGALGVAVRVIFFGQPYNQITLEGTQPDSTNIDKDFLMCRICSKRIDLFNKVTHQKYLMYLECAKRVSDKRIKEGQKDSTCILNELLADDSWLSQLFLHVRKYWAEADAIEGAFMQRQQHQQALQ